jgi:hypothetical protein
MVNKLIMKNAFFKLTAIAIYFNYNIISLLYRSCVS